MQVLKLHGMTVAASVMFLAARGASPAFAESPTVTPQKAQSLSVPYSLSWTPDGAGVVAGITSMDRVYQNTVDPITSIWTPDTGELMADDMTLASGACNAVAYEIGVAGLSGAGTPESFTVELALWNGDPCVVGSQVIAGTETVIADIPQDGVPKLLEIPLPAAVAVPGTVWMAATFSNNEAGWLIAGRAEIGSTLNVWSEDDAAQDCGLFEFTTGQYAGFYANVYCDLGGQAIGACCDGSSCTQSTEANCAGAWQGAFTSCEPNVCVSGTCCVGFGFDECTNSTEAGCRDGVFTAEATCAEGCPDNFKIYENDFRTGLFGGVDAGRKFGDDLTFAPGAPCGLLAYDITVFGDPETGPALFDAEVELWTNNDRGTPDVPEDDIPAEPIEGTNRLFTGVPADTFAQILFANNFPGVSLPPKAWIVISTSSDNAGPALAGIADIGESLDLFAIYNFSGTNTWTGGFNYGGFDPVGCPGSSCGPAGSFRVNVWCAGSPPTGACCDRFAGTCREGVAFRDCSGRWVEGGTCEPETFDPPCGTHACCYRAEFNPAFTVCQDLSVEDCAAADDGFLSRGLFCADVSHCEELNAPTCRCPVGGCLGLEGDCLTEHGTKGCEDPFCTCTVCGSPDGSFCCTNFWDEQCASDAEAMCSLGNNDLCEGAKRITGGNPAKIFSFDNSQAGRDGPPHIACPSENGSHDIDRDVWFAWTSPCTGPVYITTCDRTFVDTKIAVYEGTACPPTHESLQVCNDDVCFLQSLLFFDAVTGQDYLIRIGSSPGQGGGDGEFLLSCGSPNNASCPNATRNCCANNTGGACSNESCCETVCACDSFCCTTQWDAACAGLGFEGSGCGAAVLCVNSCGGGCPAGDAEFISETNPVVDARKPLPGVGVDEVTMLVPYGAGESCFEVCETATSGGANDIGMSSNVAGLFSLQLVRPITPSAATTVTYSDVIGATTTALLISHPGNVNGDAVADPDDIQALVDALGGESLAGGMLRRDIDHSGEFTPIDLWELVNGFNGIGGLRWNDTDRPSIVGICP